MITELQIAHLWQLMAQFYGNRWVSSYGERDISNVWFKVLKDCTPEMLAHGLKACLNDYQSWPPTLGEFNALCHGLPARNAAIKLAIDGSYTSNAFILAMRKNIGSWNLHNKTYRELEGLAQSAYDSVQHNFLNHAKQKQQLQHDQQQTKRIN